MILGQLDLSALKIDSNSLVASYLWGAIGGGFWIYGKKQRSAPPLWGGIAMIASSYLIESALWMSLAEIAIIVGIYFWSQHQE